MKGLSRKATRWIYRQTVCRPHARSYGVLSIALCFTSFLAIQLLCSGEAKVFWWGAAVCWLLISFHAVVAALALWYAWVEEPRTIKTRFRDPNYSEEEL
jgi:hypothetical protein